MQIIPLPPGNVSQIIQIRNLSALKYLDPRVGIDGLAAVCNSTKRLDVTGRRLWNLPEGWRVAVGGKGVYFRQADILGWERNTES